MGREGGPDSASERAQATRLLVASAAGTVRAADELLPLVYDKLRSIAAKYLKDERPGSTLQPTALVHEAYLRLVDHERIDWQGKTHFMAIAAVQMRRILIDHARAGAAQKRGGPGYRVTLSESLVRTPDRSIELLALDQVLTSLAALHPRQGRTAELKIFAGLLTREIAQCLRVSERTVKDDWRVARAWLIKELAARP